MIDWHDFKSFISFVVAIAFLAFVVVLSISAAVTLAKNLGLAVPARHVVITNGG